MKQSLDYSRRALGVSPENSHFKFNVAFVQFQIAQFVYSMPETARTLAEVQAAAVGLDEAIDSLGTASLDPDLAADDTNDLVPNQQTSAGT